MIVDNGYLNWPSTIPPFKNPFFHWEHEFSEWLESIRKDVECTFGIMKGRFRVLKTGTRVHGHVATDRVWLTCCALHNMLLEIDGLDNDWEGELGECSGTDVSSNIPVNILQRMRDNNQPMRSFDTSRMGRAEDGSSQDENPELIFTGDIPDGTDDTVCVVNELYHDFFCEKLVEQFLHTVAKQQFILAT